jgi:hypothetical protein
MTTSKGTQESSIMKSKRCFTTPLQVTSTQRGVDGNCWRVAITWGCELRGRVTRRYKLTETGGRVLCLSICIWRLRETGGHVLCLGICIRRLTETGGRVLFLGICIWRLRETGGHVLCLGICIWRHRETGGHVLWHGICIGRLGETGGYVLYQGICTGKLTETGGNVPYHGISTDRRNQENNRNNRLLRRNLNRSRGTSTTLHTCLKQPHVSVEPFNLNGQGHLRPNSTFYPPYRKSGSLDISHSHGPPWPVAGIALPYMSSKYFSRRIQCFHLWS